MPAASPVSTRHLLAAALTAAAALTLTACVDAPAPRPEPTESASPTPTVTEDPTSAPTEEPSALDIACADLVDPDAVYAFDPNYALIGAWEPDAGTPAAEALADGGVICRWVRESGVGTIDLSVARYAEADLEALKNEAFASSQMVPTYGSEGYFEIAGGFGTAIVFPGEYRLVISSESFAEPGEPAEIIASAIDALP
jgi:hypothetical protein